MNEECNCKGEKEEDNCCGGSNHNHADHECGCHGDSNEESCGCGDDCGCGHDHGDGSPTIKIMMDDDEELECNVLGIFDVEDKEYIALLPIGDAEDVLVYRYTEVDKEVQLDNIETDAEYELVSEAFYRYVAEDEFGDADLSDEE